MILRTMYGRLNTSATYSTIIVQNAKTARTLPGTFRFATPPLFPAFIFFQKCIFRSKEQQKIASKFQVTHKNENGYNNMNNTSLITNHAVREKMKKHRSSNCSSSPYGTCTQNMNYHEKTMISCPQN